MGNLHKISVGNSYECDKSEDVVLCNDAAKNTDLSNITLAQTHWEAFGMNGSQKFNDARHCEADMTTTPMPKTTTHVTPAPVPPSEPTVRQITVVDKADNKTVCFFANIGVQLIAKYKAKDDTTEESSFNFSENTTMIPMAVCNVNMSTFTFAHTEFANMTIQMTITNDSKSTFLSAVNVSYAMTKHGFPNAADLGKNVTITMKGMEAMKIPLGKSYSCKSNETDLYLANGTDIAVLRLTGLQWQAFGVNGSHFSEMESCFGDTRLTKVYAGDWKVQNAAKNSTCARYQMKVGTYITYPTIIDKEATVMIPLDNRTMAGANSVCGNSTTGSFSTLDVSMDGGKINFTFAFNGTSTDSQFHLQELKITYDPTSKYFPNHMVKEPVEMKNSDLDLFQTDTAKSYKCSKEVMVAFNNTMNRVDISDVYLQPFGVFKDSNGTFSDAYDCAADNSGWSTRKIVALCLIILIGLVILGGFAFCIFRVIQRKRAAYQTFA